MKGVLLVFLLFASVYGVQAQILKPVKWTFSANPVKGKPGLYELHMTATLDKSWKIYSTTTPEGGPLPTSVHFDKNPSVLLGGKVKEVGELHKVHDEGFDVDVLYYTDKVDFVQVVKVKEVASSLRSLAMTGRIEFMVCDPTQCLPPDEVKFNVVLK